MNPLVQAKQTAPLFAVAFLLACFWFLDPAQAVITDPQDWFQNGTTGVGQNALLNLREGQFNTGVGIVSLLNLLDGSYNTGVGAATLAFNTGDNNTAVGTAALLSNTTGEDNTANGFSALGRNLEGNWNTAMGSQALLFNTGDDNTATGFQALFSNTDGSWNTAVGSQALTDNTGFDNTAVGFEALSANTDGSSNTAIGRNSMVNTTHATFNTAIGRDSLLLNTIGGGNSAIGYGALSSSTTGSNNTALGYFAGSSVTDANNVICIGSLGANVSDSTWIENVWDVTPQSGNTAPVVVSDGGQLGVMASSERFKKDIANMDEASEMILSLRPVMFHYKSDAKETPQFGLIAEEVAKVNPALVLPDKDGKPFTVRYDAVNAMLLNEFLKEHRKVEKLEAALSAVNQRLLEQDAEIRKVRAEIELSKSAPQTVANNQ
jgi:Chaperone of endosialidase